MRIVIRGQNVPILEKKVPIKGYLEVIFQPNQTCPPKKACFGVNLGAKSRKIRVKEVFFPGEGKSLLGYVLKTSGHACVQH